MDTQFQPASAEVSERLRTYEDLLTVWNKSINLVSTPDIAMLRERHIAGAMVLPDWMPDTCARWLDLGSGGGIPGVVVAIVLAERNPSTRVHLVESDRRKAAFLVTARRVLGLDFKVHDVRSEMLEPQGADVISARAMAPLIDLLAHVTRHACPATVALLQKGRRAAAEIAAARRFWTFDHDAIPDGSSDGVILRVRNVRPLHV